MSAASNRWHLALQAAVLKQPYSCFIDPETPLPMMYMPDCLRATWELLVAPREKLKRCTYNVTAMSFTPAQLEASVQRHCPDFQVRENLAN
jgi:threonine 3-dehydrogenase